MNQHIQKIKLVFFPFLIIAICVIGGYSFLNWLLLIKLQLFSVKEVIINFIIPFILPWIPAIIWLRPRIKLLSLKTNRGDRPFIYLMVAVFAIAIPTIITQMYLVTATGKLTPLDTISQIDKQAVSKYYTLKKAHIDKAHVGVYNSFDVSGSHNDEFNMNLFVVLPIFTSEADTSNSTCLAWYGIKYHKQISNRLDPKEKEEEYSKFLEASQTDFDHKKVTGFVYLDRIGNSADHDGYNEAIKKNTKYQSSSTLVLLPVNEPFEKRNGSTFEWMLISMGIGALLWLIMILSPAFEKEALEKFNQGTPATEESEMKELLSFFVPREGFYITPIIMNLNIIIFIIMVFAGLGLMSFKASDLLTWGANFKPSTVNGEWWRLLTSTFLHGGLMHLFANMYGLVFVGIFLEPRLGKIKYASVYLITGIIASVASLWWHDKTVSVGASGAIFGLYGVFLALLLTKAFPKDFSKAFLISTSIFIGYNLVMGFSGGGIDNAAHIGGLVSGLIIGLIMQQQLKQEEDQFSPEQTVNS